MKMKCTGDLTRVKIACCPLVYIVRIVVVQQHRGLHLSAMTNYLLPPVKIFWHTLGLNEVHLVRHRKLY